MMSVALSASLSHASEAEAPHSRALCSRLSLHRAALGVTRLLLLQLCRRALLVHCQWAAGCTAPPVAMSNAAGFFEVLARQGWGRSSEYSIYVRRKIAYLNVSS